MSVDCKSGGTCFLYPMCSCGYADNITTAKPCDDCRNIDEYGSTGCTKEKSTMTDRCSDCETPDTCNIGGCPADFDLEPCALPVCKSPSACGPICLERAEYEKDLNERNLVCCGDPDDCNEECSVSYQGRTEDSLPGLDGRNDHSMNKFGCAYLDCGCTVPCTSKSDKNIYITINGNNNGSINL